jgi:hypothetical protein
MIFTAFEKKGVLFTCEKRERAHQGWPRGFLFFGVRADEGTASIWPRAGRSHPIFKSLTI